MTYLAPPREKPTACEQCGRQIPTAEGVHVEVRRGKVISIRCVVCGPMQHTWAPV